MLRTRGLISLEVPTRAGSKTFARPTSYKCFRSDMYEMGCEEIEATPRHRHQANARERVRTCSVNTAFAMLRTLIPTEPADRKLSKIETLRLACGYISHLGALLVSGSCESAFHENKDHSQRPQVCTFCVALIKKNDSRRFSPSEKASFGN